MLLLIVLPCANSEIRRIAQENVALHKLSLRALVLRTRDADQRVRASAFARLAVVPVRSLSIQQRVELLTNGLSDR